MSIAAFEPLTPEERARYQDPEVIRDILNRAKTIAVVGLSPKPDRASFEVAAYLQAAGYRIVPVNPNATEVLGERAYPSLRDVPFPVDLVDVFRRPEDCLEVAQDAVAIGAKALWLQLGIVNREAAAMAERAGMAVVMDRCTKIERAGTARIADS